MLTHIFCLTGQSNFNQPSAGPKIEVQNPLVFGPHSSIINIKCMDQHGKVWKTSLPNKACARLLFSMYAYTNNSCFPSIQHPYNLTRLGCCKLDIMPISFTNSWLPCFDFDESCLIAITVPSNRKPYIENRKKNAFFSYVFHLLSLSPNAKDQ